MAHTTLDKAELSGAGSVWFNLDEVFDQFVEEGGDIVESVEALEEPASEGSLDAGEQGVARLMK